MKCHNCHHKNPTHAKFCRSCGATLNQVMHTEKKSIKTPIMFDITNEKKREYKIKLLELLFVMGSIVGGLSTRSTTKPLLAGFVMSSILYYLILTKEIKSDDKKVLPITLAFTSLFVAFTASLLLADLMIPALTVKEVFDSSFYIYVLIIFIGLYSDISFFEEFSAKLKHHVQRR